MSLENLIEPRVLIVEDDDLQLEGIKNDLLSISLEKRESLGIKKFLCDTARDVEQAEGFFKKSGDHPYDLLIQDLGIPKRLGERTPPENGRVLLEKAKKTGKAKEVIVVSVFKEVATVTASFRSGAIDFVAKPFTTEILQARVLECWKRLLIKESNQILNEKRVSDMVPYAEKGILYRFSNCFSNLVKEVKYGTQDLEKYMQERYGLYRQKDTDDIFFSRINEQNDFITKAKTEWEELQNSLLQPDDFSKTSDIEKTENVETLLKETHQNLLSCLIVKNVKLDFRDKNSTEIISFGDDVGAVIKEIISGGLIGLEDYITPQKIINIEAENIKEQIRLRFTDTFEPISDKDAKNINKGSNISPYRRFGREWGLSIIQHIAMRGSGRLEIAPQPNGNVIDYFIPTAQ